MMGIKLPFALHRRPICPDMASSRALRFPTSERQSSKCPILPRKYHRTMIQLPSIWAWVKNLYFFVFVCITNDTYLMGNFPSLLRSYTLDVTTSRAKPKSATLHVWSSVIKIFLAAKSLWMIYIICKCRYRKIRIIRIFVLFLFFICSPALLLTPRDER